ncbi:hypothetical protein MMC30_007048 [Trapelia coarctata]|nr:hypothetical protein [Trapelia coarctata]
MTIDPYPEDEQQQSILHTLLNDLLIRYSDLTISRGAHRGYQNDLTLGTIFLFMSGVIYYASAAPSHPYQIKNTARIDHTSDSGTDPRIVMAEQISQDVVKQEQSVDGPPSTDVSATKPTNTPARAAPENRSDYLTNENDPTSSSSQPADSSKYQESKVVDTIQSSFAPEPRAVTVDSTVNDPDTGLVPQDGTANDTLNNIEPQESEATDNDSTRGTGVEGSIGSDSEFSKVDIADATGKELGDGQEQTRPNAVKKSTTFKPVSVTKNFLAKAGTATTPATKASTDKVNGVAGTTTNSALQSAPRPRLVAKSASGHRNSIPKALNMGSKTGRGPGPDPNQVWNRNRVATPQATPKHLTDEELKQQYGIQLASRPQEDADGKEAKWADIDDDEDDWAPETIEWNDGTKIDLSQINHTAALAEEQAATAAAKEKEAEAAKLKLPILKPTTTVGPNATVLKLGSSPQPRSGSLVLKGPSEKPTLVAKPPSSNQVKSPWASLPPVEKVSPAPVNPPTQPPPSRFAQRDVHGFDAMPPKPVHAKEIAADDFSRSSRETSNGIPKELFNSQSGRYEPVSETRRGSTTRKEQNFRAPSLLQRPTQNDSHGPAEPSAAFQTSRSGQQESASWNRRRTSSNVSGESGNLGRRMSLGKGFEIPRIPSDVRQQRRESQYEQSPLTAGFHTTRQGQRDISPVQSHGQSITSQSPTMAVSQAVSMSDSAMASPQQAHALPTGPLTPSSAAVDNQQEVVAAQKKLMREKREAAIKRKAEEEAKEEAERRERIRLKMERLGLVDDRKGKKETAEEAATSKNASKEPQEAKNVIPCSPPKPPVPNVSGAPQQYGLMKVHASHPVNGLALTNGLPEKKLNDFTPPRSGDAVIEPVVVTAAPSSTHPIASTTIAATPQHNEPAGYSSKEVKPSLSPEQLPEQLPVEPLHVQPTVDARRQSWKSAQHGSNGYSTWNNNSGMTTHSVPGGNLWGPPTNHRALGNGDFQSNVQRPQSRQPPYQSHITSPPPQPIGTPRHLQQSRGPSGQQGFAKPSESSLRSTNEESQTVPAFPSPEPSQASASAETQTRHNPQPTMASADIMSQHPTMVTPATHNTTRTTTHQTQMPIAPPKLGVSAWNNFSTTVAKQDAEKNDKAYREQQARLAEEKRAGTKKEVQLPAFAETWRQVKTSDVPGQRKVVAALATPNQPPPLGQAPPVLGDMSGETSKPSTNLGPLAPQVRSRYQELFEQTQRTVSAPIHVNRSASVSPPPPDSLDHPAYVATSQRPLVNLPGSKPKFTGPRPTVKLPPPTVSPQLQASEPRVAAPRSVSQPSTGASSWQDRINGLFDRKPSPEKKFAEVLYFSSSKVPLALEVPSVSLSAAVTLPPQDDVVNTVGATEALQMPTKVVEEEDALFEERDFGSVPTVRVPVMAPVQAWTPAGPPQSYRSRFMILSEQQILSVLAMMPGLDDTHRANGLPITIRIGSMTAPKVKMMTRPMGYGSSRSRNGNSSKSKTRHHQPKSRDSSAAYPSPKPAHNNSTRPPAQNGPHQQARPKGNNGNMSWARRASGAVQQ